MHDLLDFVIFAVLVFYVLTVTGLFMLRRTQPDAERPYKAFGYPVLPALYVGLCAAIMLDLLFVKPKFHLAGADHRADGHSGVLHLALLNKTRGKQVDPLVR